MFRKWRQALPPPSRPLSSPQKGELVGTVDLRPGRSSPSELDFQRVTWLYAAGYLLN